MADLQRLDAGRLDVFRLERRHHAAAVVAEAQRVVEIGAEAFAHEAAVAAECAAARRRALPRAAPAASSPAARARRPCRRRGPPAGRWPLAFFEQAAAVGGGPSAVADGGEIARTTALERQARHGAGDIGRAAQRVAQIVAQQVGARSDSRRHRGGRRSGLDVGEGLARRAASSRARRGRSRCGRWRRAGCPRARRMSSASSSRLARLAASMTRMSPGPVRRGADDRALADLGQLHVLQQRADRRQLGAGEGAEAAELADARGCSLSRRSPARLSKEAAATGVTAVRPASPAALGSGRPARRRRR